MRFWAKDKSLKDTLGGVTKVRVKDILFHLKKIDILDYMNGSKVLVKQFDVYRAHTSSTAQRQQSINKIKEHYSDVFMAGVVKPRLSRDKDCDEDIYVGELFNDWDLASALYEKIVEVTYGKKKLKSVGYRAQR